ncbi:ureide permease 1-like protein isoform X1, partial [Tanacetum coccineum]
CVLLPEGYISRKSGVDEKEEVVMLDDINLENSSLSYLWLESWNQKVEEEVVDDANDRCDNSSMVDCKAGIKALPLIEFLLWCAPFLGEYANLHKKFMLFLTGMLSMFIVAVGVLIASTIYRKN